ncbi:MAG TPA: TfoX/Sxy family protein, partial [Anaerolineales bacterium]|nr:TfoX/Sxy family protein [Anaerolineales bacterium]
MAYDEGLAERINQVLERLDPPGLVDKKMFGGIGYLVQGNMACGILDDLLIVRVGKESYEEALQKPGARVFDTTGRPMTGWVMVAGAAVSEDDDLTEWIQQGVE